MDSHGSSPRRGGESSKGACANDTWCSDCKQTSLPLMRRSESSIEDRKFKQVQSEKEHVLLLINRECFKKLIVLHV
jgi:hypothetical protein